MAEKRIGTIKLYRRTFEVRVEVTLKDGRLSITGTIGVDGSEQAGQIQKTLRSAEWVEGPTVDLERLLSIWDRWHLNDMRAGCEHQRAYGWDKKPILADRPLDAYVTWEALDGMKRSTWNMLTWASRKEHVLGLLGEPCPVCGYKYGSSWLMEELPADVVEWAKNW